VLGFNVRADAMARKTADKEGVRIEYYSIIYNLIDDVMVSVVRLIVKLVFVAFRISTQH
jgi:translation initiation factor IF-2